MTQTIVRSFGEILDNPVGLDRELLVPICDGLNISLASFQALYLQYQKHHFVIEGAEFYQLHQFFAEGYQAAQNHVHALAERLNGLGGIPAASLAKLAELCCFTPESDDILTARAMVSQDLYAEQQIIQVLRRQATQCDSVSDRATRYLYEQILLATEDRAFHLQHFLASDSLILALV